MKYWFIFPVIAIILTIALGIYAVKKESSITKECESLGGVIIGARQPAYICIKKEAILLMEK